MANVDEHPHPFAPGEWPFADPVNLLAYTSSRILRDGFPVLRVLHDHDGDWQFLHGSVDDDDDIEIVFLGCAFQRDWTIGMLSTLLVGWKASRGSVDTPWQC